MSRVCAIEPALQLQPGEGGVDDMFAAREPGFAGLIQIILEQQVSVRAGQAMWAKLHAICPEFGPEPFLKLDDDTLKTCGFSRQKVRYARGAAEAILNGELDLPGLADLAEAEAMKQLTALKGIGRWTAEVYLLSCLGWMDIWPAGDLALVLAVEHLAGMDRRPNIKQMDAYGERFAGDRSAASLLLWHYYRRHLRPNAF
ncbi:MAG: DNA-3-methyladenine glycosylase 2 family protein [Alphaproteobacteria bacterium]|nr:DNA-3-methyladenine glycosylase 2 family protein [Alphaproteobacteria bacterium SS10]